MQTLEGKWICTAHGRVVDVDHVVVVVDIEHVVVVCVVVGVTIVVVVGDLLLLIGGL